MGAQLKLLFLSVGALRRQRHALEDPLFSPEAEWFAPPAEITEARAAEPRKRLDGRHAFQLLIGFLIC